MLSKSMKHVAESEEFQTSDCFTSHVVDCGGMMGKTLERGELSKRQMDTSCHRVEKLSINGNCEEHVDTPLQSGIVNVFKLPGIEAPSDEDDYIEVRFKRQMLNQRWEQREMESKVMSRAMKVARKSHSFSQRNGSSSTSNKSARSSAREMVIARHLESGVTDRRVSINGEASTISANVMASQLLPPICALDVNSTTQADTSSPNTKLWP